MGDNIFYTSVDRNKNQILFRGFNNGRPFKRKIDYQPTLFVPSQSPSKWRSLDNKYVEPIKPGSMYDCYKFTQQYEGVENFTIYGTTNYVHQLISDLFLDRCDWDRDLVDVTSIDIEVQSDGDSGFPVPEKAAVPVTAISVRSSRDNVYHCWGTGDYNVESCLIKAINVEYHHCQTENELLTRFIGHWMANYPNVITGWNCRLFDIPYLINRIDNVLGPNYGKTLSPWSLIRPVNVEIGNQQHIAYDVVGIQQLDYIDLFKKFGHTYGTPENYKLDTIAFMVLGEKKLDYGEYGSLSKLYIENHQKFIDYNIKDVWLIDRLEDKMGLITLAMTVAYRGLVNMSECFGPVNLWDALLYNELRRRNIVVPPRKTQHKERGIEGAYVKDPQPGYYKWLCSFDLNSLYPHLMMQYNMSPETIINGIYPGVSVDKLLQRITLDIPDNRCITATGQYFTTSCRGVIPDMIDKLYGERSAIKKQTLALKQQKEGVTELIDIEKQITRLDTQQMAIKILMNSLYGAMSNEWFRYFDIRIAESITITGQLSIRWAEQTINQFMNNAVGTSNVDYVIAIDTDSLYINFERYVQLNYNGFDTNHIVKSIDDLCHTMIEPILARSYTELADYMHCMQQRMVMKREVIADQGIWTGKKHYILNVHNSEGVQYAMPKVKLVGIEAVRSSTPGVCRKMIIDTINLILNSDEKTVQQVISELRDRFKQKPVEDIAFPRGVSDIGKYYDPQSLYSKGTPIHVRAALLYNDLLEKHKLTGTFEPLSSGNKLKFVYLKVPNNIGENVIGFASVLPKDFGVHRYIDYDTMFEKGFMEPIKTILSARGWEVEKTATLIDFFS